VSTLKLRRDNTTYLEIRSKDGEFKNVIGTWEIDNGYLYIEPCWTISRSSHGVMADGCGLAAETFLFGTVMLWINTDTGVGYKKVSSD
jgi:hypothetical protein